MNHIARNLERSDTVYSSKGFDYLYQNPRPNSGLRLLKDTKLTRERSADQPHRAELGARVKWLLYLAASSVYSSKSFDHLYHTDLGLGLLTCAKLTRERSADQPHRCGLSTGYEPAPTGHEPFGALTIMLSIKKSLSADQPHCAEPRARVKWLLQL